MTTVPRWPDAAFGPNNTFLGHVRGVDLYQFSERPGHAGQRWSQILMVWGDCTYQGGSEIVGGDAPYVFLYYLDLWETFTERYPDKADAVEAALALLGHPLRTR